MTKTDACILDKLSEEIESSLGLLRDAIMRRALEKIGKSRETFSKGDLERFIDAVKNDHMLVGLVGVDGTDELAERLSSAAKEVV